VSEQIIEYYPSASAHPVPVEHQKSGQHPHRNNIQSNDTRYAVRSRPCMEDSAQQHQESEEEPAQSHRTSEEVEPSGEIAHRGVADTSAWTVITPPNNKNAKHDSKHTWNHFLLRLDRFINHLNGFM
jgi:hypothetical protein